MNLNILSNAFNEEINVAHVNNISKLCFDTFGS